MSKLLSEPAENVVAEEVDDDMHEPALSNALLAAGDAVIDVAEDMVLDDIIGDAAREDSTASAAAVESAGPA